MKDTLKYIAYIVIALAAVTIFLLAPSRCKWEKIVVKHDTIIIKDTIIKPSTCYISTRQVDTILVSELDTTVIHDTLFVYVPISHYHFHYPDTADIYVSGYNTKVDSAFFHFTTSVVYNTIEVPAQPKKIKFGLEAGLDAVIIDRRLVPNLYLDAGLTIRQKARFKIGIGSSYDNGVKAFMHGSVTYIIK